MTPTGSPSNAAFMLLRGLARKRGVEERCDLCGAALGDVHEHLVSPATRQLFCACPACALLFHTGGGGPGTKYRRVPRRILCFPDFRLTDAHWESLRLPIHLAFFFYSSPAEKIVAVYPSPAGPTESLLALDAWDEIVRENPHLGQLEPDVEALLVDRSGREGSDRYYQAPIDECYRLVGIIRTRWRGLSGGDAVWEEIERFFADLGKRAERVGETARA
jgi:hypothetical protein